MRYYCCLNRQVAALKCMGRMGKIVILFAKININYIVNLILFTDVRA